MFIKNILLEIKGLLRNFMISTPLEQVFNILFSYNEAIEAKPHELGTSGHGRNHYLSFQQLLFLTSQNLSSY